MNCNKYEGDVLDLAAGLRGTPEAERHLRDCKPCAARYEELRTTMVMMDDWAAPEPSPFFDTKLKAQLREAAETSGGRWMAWLRKPALALSLTAALAIAATYYKFGPQQPTPATETNVAENAMIVQPGTAVGDLQALDTTEDVIELVHGNDNTEDIYLF